MTIKNQKAPPSQTIKIAATYTLLFMTLTPNQIRSGLVSIKENNEEKKEEKTSSHMNKLQQREFNLNAFRRQNNTPRVSQSNNTHNQYNRSLRHR